MLHSYFTRAERRISGRLEVLSGQLGSALKGAACASKLEEGALAPDECGEPQTPLMDTCEPSPSIPSNDLIEPHLVAF